MKARITREAMAAPRIDGGAWGSVFQMTDPHGVEETLDPTILRVRIVLVGGVAVDASVVL